MPRSGRRRSTTSSKGSPPGCRLRITVVKYAGASRQLGGVLAARKATRDFRTCKPLSAEGLPKSSLDGALETVLPDWPAGDRARRRLRLSGGEQLDALGVIKRMAGESDQFTAYSRIAADPGSSNSRSTAERLRTACEPLVSLELATRARGNAGIYEALPFDAQMLYAFRLDNALSQAREQPKEHQALLALRRCIARISQEKTSSGRPHGHPVPYAAILKADGDRMGVLLSKARSADRSRRISRALHGFASNVRKITRAHRGHAIYAGGDDVLALVPLAQALDCASTLAREFRRALDPIADEMDMPAAEHPTPVRRPWHRPPDGASGRAPRSRRPGGAGGERR